MKAAYRKLDAFHHGTVEGRSSVTVLLAEAVGLQNSQDLFELYVFDHLLLTRCKARARAWRKHSGRPAGRAGMLMVRRQRAGGAGVPQGAVGHGGLCHGHLQRVACHAVGQDPGG